MRLLIFLARACLGSFQNSLPDSERVEFVSKRYQGRNPFYFDLGQLETYNLIVGKDYLGESLSFGRILCKLHLLNNGCGSVFYDMDIC